MIAQFKNISPRRYREMNIKERTNVIRLMNPHWARFTEIMQPVREK